MVADRERARIHTAQAQEKRSWFFLRWHNRSRNSAIDMTINTKARYQ